MLTEDEISTARLHLKIEIVCWGCSIGGEQIAEGEFYDISSNSIVRPGPLQGRLREEGGVEGARKNP